MARATLQAPEVPSWAFAQSCCPEGNWAWQDLPSKGAPFCPNPHWATRLILTSVQVRRSVSTGKGQCRMRLSRRWREGRGKWPEQIPAPSGLHVPVVKWGHDPSCLPRARLASDQEPA